MDNLFNTNTNQAKNAAKASYFSRFYSMIPWDSSSTISTISTNTTSSSDEDEYDDIDDGYCIVKYKNPIASVSATLKLISKCEIDWHNNEEITNEISIIRDKLVTICHQFDKHSITDQSTNTHVKIGSELHLFVKFIKIRYLNTNNNEGSTWLAVMAFLMIAMEVLKTAKEVKSQLLLKTKIGRTIIIEMENSLKKQSTTTSIKLSNNLQSTILEIITGSNDNDWFELLKNTCFMLADVNKHWESKQKYYEVVSLATALMLENE